MKLVFLWKLLRQREDKWNNISTRLPLTQVNPNAFLYFKGLRYASSDTPVGESEVGGVWGAGGSLCSTKFVTLRLHHSATLVPHTSIGLRVWQGVKVWSGCISVSSSLFVFFLRHSVCAPGRELNWKCALKVCAASPRFHDQSHWDDQNRDTLHPFPLYDGGLFTPLSTVGKGTNTFSFWLQSDVPRRMKHTYRKSPINLGNKAWTPNLNWTGSSLLHWFGLQQKPCPAVVSSKFSTQEHLSIIHHATYYFLFPHSERPYISLTAYRESELPRSQPQTTSVKFLFELYSCKAKESQ